MTGYQEHYLGATASALGIAVAQSIFGKESISAWPVAICWGLVVVILFIKEKK